MPLAHYTLCDVFATGPLSGNQLAVVDAEPEVPEVDRQALAREFNFSETTFPGVQASDGVVSLRIYTPSVELPYAGHPILGTAAVVAHHGRHPKVTLSAPAATVECRLEWDGPRRAEVEMDQPVPTVREVEDPGEILAALGIGASVLPVELYDNGMGHVVITLPDVVAVAALRPDFNALARVSVIDGQHCGVNCMSGSDHRFTTRMFAPGDGVAEDPATGSAAGPIACHLARHGWSAWGETIELSQGAQVGRPSRLRPTAVGSAAGIEAVTVSGTVNVLGRGQLEW